MKKQKVVLYTVVGVLVIGLAVFLIKKYAATTPEDTSQIPTPDPSTAVVALKRAEQTVKEKRKNTALSISYPIFSDTPANINSDIKNFINQEIDDAVTSNVDFPTDSAAAEELFLDISYDIEQANTKYMSLVFTIDEYTGGAHPNERFTAFNYNTKTGEEIKLSSLYPDDPVFMTKLKPKIKASVLSTLTETLKKEGDTESKPEDVLFEDILKLTDDVFSTFTFSDGYIRFFFAPYELAPYAVGPIITTVER